MCCCNRRYAWDAANSGHGCGADRELVVHHAHYCSVWQMERRQARNGKRKANGAGPEDTRQIWRAGRGVDRSARIWPSYWRVHFTGVGGTQGLCDLVADHSRCPVDGRRRIGHAGYRYRQSPEIDGEIAHGLIALLWIALLPAPVRLLLNRGKGQ